MSAEHDRRDNERHPDAMDFAGKVIRPDTRGKEMEEVRGGTVKVDPGIEQLRLDAERTQVLGTPANLRKRPSVDKADRLIAGKNCPHRILLVMRE
jgi:hypothetical protein